MNIYLLEIGFSYVPSCHHANTLISGGFCLCVLKLLLKLKAHFVS